MDRQVRRNIKAWIAALRSGRYEQTFGGLRAGNSFCCLGVACDLHPRIHLSENKYTGLMRYHYGNYSNYGIMPGASREQFGLDAVTEHTLTEMNDYGKSFDEIADWIEVNVLVETTLQRWLYKLFGW